MIVSEVTTEPSLLKDTSSMVAERHGLSMYTSAAPTMVNSVVTGLSATVIVMLTVRSYAVIETLL